MEKYILYIKIINSAKEIKYLPFEKFQRLTKSNSNLVEITDDEGNYLGETINKSFIVSSEPDFEYSKKVFLYKLKELVSTQGLSEYRKFEQLHPRDIVELCLNKKLSDNYLLENYE